ncbi:reverse transcriptase domain-containing protein, partial [Tanacetum coccineum]
MTHLLEKETPFFFSEECIKSFNTLKRKLTEALILIAPDWDLPFELMCDASDFAIGHAVLVPEPSSSRTEGPTIEFRTQTSSVVLPFIAPPSSPASFLQSEPPSAIQSPSGLISFTAASSGMYSPSDPTNMFAV